MSVEHADVLGRAAELRRAFDQTFAEPARAVIEDVENLLGLHVGQDEYAVRLGEIRGLLPEQNIVPVPSPVPELLGIIGLRGSIVPVYSLGALLGYGPAPRLSPWIILVGTDAPVGMAFDEFQGHLRVTRSQIVAKGDDASRSHVRETVRVADTLRGIISIRSVVLALTARLGVIGTIKET